MNCSLEIKVMTMQANRDKYIEPFKDNSRWRLKYLDSPEDDKSIITLTSEGPYVLADLLSDVNGLSVIVESVSVGYKNEVIEEAEEEREVSSKAMSLKGNNTDSVPDISS
mmetsp:Transcript_16257/g.13895  ORF Transcript_16257/g.13895 Transcript_16257/m.13895 type:complete len:110 (+) Transcript_16257:1518-1847(+)